MDSAYRPGKETAVACVNCGKLICLECKTELAGKNYCPPCANEIFVAKRPAEAVETPAEVAEEVAVTEEKISGAWWLMPVFLVCVGGLVVWLVSKDKARDGLNPCQSGGLS